MRWLPIVFLLACEHPAPLPLPQAILGDWESWCVSDNNNSACLSKDRDPSRTTFGSDGTLAIKGDSIDEHGHWELHGDELAMSLELYGQTYHTRFRARIERGRLVLWSGDHVEVYGRVGATFEPAPSPTTDGKPVVRVLQGITYTLPLPAGYRLGDATGYRETWMPIRGEGFEVSVKIAPRGETSRPDGSMGTTTCKDFGGGEGGGSETKDGVEREIYFDIMTCIEGTSLYASCKVEHTRGYVESSEKDAALALCRPLKLAR